MEPINPLGFLAPICHYITYDLLLVYSDVLLPCQWWCPLCCVHYIVYILANKDNLKKCELFQFATDRTSHLDAQKHLDDLLHSAGKTFPLLFGQGLSYNHSQLTHGRLLELDIPKIEMGTAVVINNLWPILNYSKYGYSTHPLFNLLAGWLILIHLELFLPLVTSMTTSQRWWAWWRNTRKTLASSTWTRTWDVFCDALAARLTDTSLVLVCGCIDDADVFILLFHHANRLCDVIIKLDVSGRNSWRCININELARKNRPASEWDISFCCTVVQNRPKVVNIDSSPHFYSRYVKFWLLSIRTLAMTIQYYSVRMEKTCLSSWWWVNQLI